MDKAEENLRRRFVYLPKDYVETAAGHVFACVALGTEDNRVLGQLRYLRKDGQLAKLEDKQAAALLQRHPKYRYYSQSRDAWLAGVSCDSVQRHFKPSEALFQKQGDGTLLAKAARLATMLGTIPGVQCGLTGGVLLGTNHADSDLDIVVYGRAAFHRCTDWVKEQLQCAQSGTVAPLTKADWQTAWSRRDCSLALDQYCWHERRKANKFMFEGTRIDLSCVDVPHPLAMQAGRKQQAARVRCRVQDASFAFGLPATYFIEHPQIKVIVVCTATYEGMARKGELIECTGTIEQCDGFQRLVVGTSRAGKGQWLCVAR